MVLPIWKSLYSLNLMLPKEDRKAMLLRMFNDETPLQDSSKDRFKKVQETEEESFTSAADVIIDVTEGAESRGSPVEGERPTDAAKSLADVAGGGDEGAQSPDPVESSQDEEEEGGVVLQEGEIVGELK
jgi:NADH dehydrogenase/NADH:ubiquinone oxidoreductase subunit G